MSEPRECLADMPSFVDFYKAINDGLEPFPWQARLADKIAKTGRWPSEIGVPTGLGKTACLDIAVWWLASQAHLEPGERTAPTRIWWVVNRRLLIDSTAQHAEEIQSLLENCSDKALVVVAERLRYLAADPNARPLQVIKLRGGLASNRPSDPTQPAVVLSTIPMYGSRLLFRGYGSSRSMRPIDAALAGTDSLVLVDEAHLARHLVDLFDSIVQCNPSSESIIGSRPRPVVVSLTATGDQHQNSFDLDKNDEANPIVRQRLDALKPTEVHEHEKGNIAKVIAEATLSLIDGASEPTTCVVFTNTPKTAREIHERIQKLSKADAVLLTGRIREREADLIRKKVLDGMGSDRQPVRRDRHLIVVATQTLEVGADIDSEHLVTEACGVRALTQRLGRLNRLGRFSHARAVYMHIPPPSGKWPVYGDEPTIVLSRLRQSLSEYQESIDLSPRNISKILGPPVEDPGRAPEILPGILWEWVKTTTPPRNEAPVEPYFSGISGPERYVTFIWRAHVPDEGQRLWPPATDRESIDIPIAEARDALSKDEDLRKLSADGVTIENTEMNRISPGDRIVLPCDRGLLDQYGWAPNSQETVVDISILSNGIPLDVEAIRRLCPNISVSFEDIAAAVRTDEDIDEPTRKEALDRVRQAIADFPPLGVNDHEWTELVTDLHAEPSFAKGEVPRLRRRRQTNLIRYDEFDEMSLTDTAVELSQHGLGVGIRARSIAEKIGVSPKLIGLVELAGRFHDVGKADLRFQRWLDPDGERDSTVAKSKRSRSRWEDDRAAAGWPRGGRHEDLSARLVLSWLESRANGFAPGLADLLVHLVISHHGRGRPLVRPVVDSTASTVSCDLEGVKVTVPADLSIIDWGQPTRFRRLNDRFGPWGLALLESIVRQADHSVSAGAVVGELEVH